MARDLFLEIIDDEDGHPDGVQPALYSQIAIGDIRRWVSRARRYRNLLLRVVGTHGMAAYQDGVNATKAFIEEADLEDLDAGDLITLTTVLGISDTERATLLEAYMAVVGKDGSANG